MAVKKGCVILARKVGHEYSIALARYRVRMANAAWLERVGLRARAHQARTQAQRDLDRRREELLSEMEVNGCL